jgi:xanthine dehydrogenase YagR molybdenum-binding subunit
MNTTVLGKPQDRIDGRLKVTGQATYSGDRVLENLAYGYLLTSTIAKGEIQSIDSSLAERMPGVLAVYTPSNPLKLYRPLDRSEGGGSGDAEPPLQNRKIDYYGQIIGIVVAESFEQARDAAQSVTVSYNKQTPIVTWDAAMGGAFAPDNVDGENTISTILGPGASSIDEALNSSEFRIASTYTEPIYHHSPMEPHASTAIWNGDRLTMYESTQGVIGHRRNIAAVLDLDDSKVQVICPYVGGAFGCKGSMWMHSPLTAEAARALGRPVRTVLTREQMFTIVGHRPALIQTISLGSNKDGVLQAVKHDAQSTISFTKAFVEAAAHRTSRFLYKSPNIQVSHKLVPLNVGPPTFMRAPGEAPGMFALECGMDELAVKLGIDPVEFRIRNNAELFPGRNVPWSSKNLTECYRLGAEKFGWSNRNPTPRAAKLGDWHYGTGMATAVYPAHRSPASAKVRFQADGTVRVASATLDLGTGMWTVLAIVGAETLELPIDRIKPDLGDSDLPPAPGAGGSHSTASVAPAVQKAAESAKNKLIQFATKEKRSPFFGSNAVSYKNGDLISGDQRIEFSAFLNMIGRGSVEAMESTEQGSESSKYAFHSFGAQFCEVKVNEWTSEVRVNRVTTVMDIGTAVNPKTARSQVIGGAVFAIGMALFEGSHLDETNGRFANGNFADYLVPTNADVPVIDVHFLDKPDTIFNPIGARGVGEIGVTGLPSAIANAVYNATGIRVRDFPITPEKLSTIGNDSQKISKS